DTLTLFRDSQGAVFPDILVDDVEVCECSTSAQRLIAGQNFSIKVQAENSVGPGNFSAPSILKIMGEPSIVLTLSTMEYESNMTVLWAPPADTGFGTADPTAPIVGYHIQTSLCKDFDQLDFSCKVKKYNFLAQAVCASGSCKAGIVEKDNLIQNQVYYVRVVAYNAVADGFLSFATIVRQTWKLFPSYWYPSDELLPFGLAEYGGVSLFWIGGGAYDTAYVEVVDFPYAETGTTLSATFTKDGVVKYGSAYVVGRTEVSPDADINDVLGIDVVTFFDITPPVFDSELGGAGSATVEFFVALYPTKSIAYPLYYFEYPAPTVALIAPSAGGVGGGTYMRMLIEEPSGPWTREDAGLTNFLDASAAAIEIIFDGSNNAALESVKRVGLAGAQIYLRSPAQASKLEIAVPVTFKISGVAVAMTQAVEFRYRGAYLGTVVPASGLTDSPITLKIRVFDPNLVVLTGAAPIVTVDGVACTATSVEVFFLDPNLASDTELFVYATTPTSSAGAKTVLVTYFDTNRGAVTVQEASFFTYVTPPTPEILLTSIVVEGRTGGEQWASMSLSTKVTFKVKYIFASGTSTVTFGGSGGSSVTVASVGNAADRRFASTTVTVTTPTFGSARFVDIVFTSGGVSATTANTPFEMRDTSFPSIVSVFPSEAPFSSGSIVVVGVTGYCRGASTTCTPTISANFDGSSYADALGLVSVSSWNSRDATYDALFGSVPALASWYINAGSGTRARLTSLVSRTTADADISSSDTLTQANSFVVFFQAPAVAAAATNTVRVKATALGESTYKTTPFAYVADPTGVATVSSVTPSKSALGGDIKITVSLTNFAIVEAPSDVVNPKPDQQTLYPTPCPINPEP
ncbi:hypothetical protein T484DRAFT_3647262, partial [Baffinella frigidus]